LVLSIDEFQYLQKLALVISVQVPGLIDEAAQLLLAHYQIEVQEALLHSGSSNT
jgi:hypothetical protein